MRDIRGRAKREQEWLAANPLQRCVVSQRLFIRRRDNVCSMRCKAEADAPVENVTTEQEGRQS